MPLLIFFLFGMHGIFVVVAGHIDRCHLQRIHRNNLQVHAALIALNRLALLHLVDINNDRIIALGTYNSHDPSSMGSFAHPPIGFNLWEYRNSNSRTPYYLFSGLPAHSSSIRLQPYFGLPTRSIHVTVGPRFLTHFSRFTLGAALL